MSGSGITLHRYLCSTQYLSVVLALDFLLSHCFPSYNFIALSSSHISEMFTAVITYYQNLFVPRKLQNYGS